MQRRWEKMNDQDVRGVWAQVLHDRLLQIRHSSKLLKANGHGIREVTERTGCPWGRSASASRWDVIFSFNFSIPTDCWKRVDTAPARLLREDERRGCHEVGVQVLDDGMWLLPLNPPIDHTVATESSQYVRGYREKLNDPNVLEVEVQLRKGLRAPRLTIQTALRTPNSLDPPTR